VPLSAVVQRHWNAFTCFFEQAERIDMCPIGCDMRIVGGMRAAKNHSGVLEIVATTTTQRPEAKGVRRSRVSSMH